ncbi:hydrogenase nickel incorporation protein HypB [Akkermansia sp.]|uniref:hydrogenase nickel incorporation protein HypB n=1 Tax=Akkermansia sp. TaxID=1872421 RepID=UPI003A87BECD
MCKDCGCGGEHTHEGHAHGMDVHVPVLDDNDRLAERNRGFFEAKKLLVINVFSSPGSGKTSLLQKTAEMLRNRVRMGVIVGDLATDHDAERLSRADIPVVQITTGTMCHLDARMIAEAMKRMPLDDLDVLVIENVGNLVCPASYDLGEGMRVVLLSVTEGEDKPLKYPPMFHSADVALVTKSDLADAVDFDRDAALAALNKVAHHARVVELSSKTGEGMDIWCGEIEERVRRIRSGRVQEHVHHHH